MNANVITRQNLHSIAKRLARRDESLRATYRRLGPPPLWKRPASFATFIRIILEQQVSLQSAKATFEKLRDECGGPVRAASIVELGESRLRELGFTRQKARYTVSLAHDVQSKDFKINSLLHQDDDEVRQRITARLGLGPWTADVYLLMALCRADVFPVGDLALVKGMRMLDGGTYETYDEVMQRAEPWRPYRSVGARMVWQLYLDQRKAKSLT